MRVLVLGGAGFVGHHFVEHVQQNTDWTMTALVSLRHRGDSMRLVNFDPDRIELFKHDLTAPVSARLLQHLEPVDAIVSFAADSHVDRSITEPRPFIENNVAVQLTVLELARALQPRALVLVSTDEVYGPAQPGQAHEPWAPIIPSNPYSASKAAQEAVSIAFWRTYGVPLVVNTMNMIGERQDTEKFLPSIIANVRAGRTVTIHGAPDHIGSRFYLHARNLASAIVHALDGDEPPRFPATDRPTRYHVVGEREINNLQLAEQVADIMGKHLDYQFEDFHRTRPGHDPRYALAPAYPPGWTPPVSFDESLERTIAWTLDHPEWLR
jgi:dTDP-glucose 4,6-dehydratase